MGAREGGHGREARERRGPKGGLIKCKDYIHRMCMLCKKPDWFPG